MKTSDQYLKIVEWSEEAPCYVGSCPGLMRGGVHGNDEAEVYKELHKTLTVEALRYGESLNAYCVHLLKEESPRYRVNSKRATRFWLCATRVLRSKKGSVSVLLRRNYEVEPLCSSLATKWRVAVGAVRQKLIFQRAEQV